MGVVATASHIVLVSTWVAGIHYNVNKLNPPSTPELDFVYKQYGGRLKFLTFLNALLQCGFFGLSVLNDVFGSESVTQNKKSGLQRFRDWAFTTLVFPMGAFVSFIFWALYAVDRELIFPVSLDAWFPCWLNHILHTLPIVGVLTELCLVCHAFQKGFKRYIPILVAYVLYLSWICYIAYAAGFWVYPVFEVLDFKGRTAFLACLLLPNLLIVHLALKLHLSVWGTQKQQKKKGKKE